MVTLLGTKYPKSIRDPHPTRMLKPGANNKKLGSIVSVTKWRDAVIYSLTLEERASCPTTCDQWTKCYGNNMPFAHRFDHTHPDFLSNLEENIKIVCRQHKKVLVRLHVLGDFFSTDYVEFWMRMTAEHPELHIFGYTHHAPDSDIGMLISAMNLTPWCAIRFSDQPGIRFSAQVIPVDGQPGMHEVICPEQDGKTESCATCGLCWGAMNKTILFKEH